MERRLAAILAADVAGYTALMGADEAGTLQRLTDLRQEFLEPLIADHHGRVVKLMGDGLLVEFASVVDAVTCALAWQKGVPEREAAADEEKPLQFRIGINLGDVIVEGDDIHGDGVNIAARLEGLAEPGEIRLSDDAYRQARGKLEANFEDLGEQKLKNVAEPVRIYRVAGGSAGTTGATPARAPLALPEKSSLAVLPFANMSGELEQEYFSDGITEDIITDLSRFGSLFVIARNSSFQYRGRSLRIQQVGRELGVRYVVEGSVRRSGDRVRITAQLIEAESGKQLWAERYDRHLDDIFTVQDEVTNAIVTAVEPTIGSTERDRAHRKPPESLDAWESYQHGLWNLYHFRAQENMEAQSFFRRAIRIDPNFAPAHAGLAHAIYISFMLGFVPDLTSVLGEARSAAQRAVILDNDDALSHAMLGRVHLMTGELDEAIYACEAALALNPNLAMAHYGLGGPLNWSGRHEEAILELDKAIRLSPRDPLLWHFLTIKAQACMALERYEEGLELGRAARRQPNAGLWAHSTEVVALAHLDRMEEARRALERVKAIKRDFNLSFVVNTFKQIGAVGFEYYLDGLRKAGLNG